MLELDEGQLSRPVLRGGGGGNATSLPGKVLPVPGVALTASGGRVCRRAHLRPPRCSAAVMQPSGASAEVAEDLNAGHRAVPRLLCSHGGQRRSCGRGSAGTAGPLVNTVQLKKLLRDYLVPTLRVGKRDGVIKFRHNTVGNHPWKRARNNPDKSLMIANTRICRVGTGHHPGIGGRCPPYKD